MIYFLLASIAANVFASIKLYQFIKKDEFKDDILDIQNTYIQNLSELIDNCDVKLREVDAKGSFESDDEIGFFFKAVKDIQEKLNKFKIK
jgi:hypothetical protein